MADKAPRCEIALHYAAMSDEKRGYIPDEARVKILKLAYSRGEEAASVGKDVLRAAKMQWFLSRPFTDSERIGRYAALLMESIPAQAVVLCLFSRDKMLTEKHILAYGRAADPKVYAPRIPALFRKAGASFAALLFAPRAAEYGYTIEDLRLASRIAQYCKQQNVPLIECVVAWFDGYVPLFRLYGYQ